MSIKKNRFNVLELLLQWQGKLTSTELSQLTQTSKDTAKRSIQEYNRLYPTAAIYDVSKKCYKPSPSFKPQVSACELHAYLKLLDEHFFLLSTVQNSSDYSLHTSHSYIYSINPPARNIQPHLIRKILKACKQKLRIEVEYLSLSNDEFEVRIIQPHSLVFDGNRWHIRGYDERRRRYQDFNLSRFQGDIEFEGEGSNAMEYDKDWNTQVDIVICPDPRLSPAQKRCIEQEYQMQTGRLVVPCKAALVNYVLLQLRVESYKNKAVAQQIILDEQCRVSLRPYLWHE